MKGVILVCIIVKVIFQVQCEADSASNDQSVVHGIAAKIGFPATVLKVFIKGDIQADEIEKLLNLCIREDKGQNDSDLTRNRRNSISDYIGKLYGFNNLFRPYRRYKHGQSTRTPWIKKLIRSGQDEPSTESFWGMALGAHTFSPFARPVAQTRMPYHRIRDQQRIDRLLGITRNYGNFLAPSNEAHPNHWIKTEDKFDQLLGRAKSDEKTTAIMHQMNTRKAFHKAPLDVAGLKTVTYPHHLHTVTQRRLKFCEKQCAYELEEARTKRPGSPSLTPYSSAGDQDNNSEEQNRDGTCTCTINAHDDDYLSDGEGAKRNGKGKVGAAPTAAVTKRVARTKHTKLTTYKLTTSKFTRSKVQGPTGPVWTLPPNAVLDQERTMGEQRTTFSAAKTTAGYTTESMSGMEYTTETSSPQDSSPGHIPSPDGTKGPPEMCIPMPIPTRIKAPVCCKHKTTRRCTRKTTCSTTCCTRKTTCSTTCTRKTTCCTAEDNCSPPDTCDCQRRNSPSDETVSIGESLNNQNKKPCECNQGKPQKIIVRISSSLGEVPVVIMRDNGVSGVSLSLVNDYLLDENNRLIKCLCQKPLRGRMGINNLNITRKPVPHPNGYRRGMDMNNLNITRKPVSHPNGYKSGTDMSNLNITRKAVPHPYGYKSRHFLPHLIRHQLHGLQPKRYSFRINYDPSRHGLISGPRASVGNANSIPNPAFSGSEFSNQFPSYKANLPDSQMTGFGTWGLQYPAIQNPDYYHYFKMKPGDSEIERVGPVGPPVPQMNLDGYPASSPTEYPTFEIHPGFSHGRISLPGFEQAGLNFQPVFPRQVADSSQFKGYRSPFMPPFYPNNVLHNIS